MAIQQLKDEYEILEEIGSGGMATVFKAVQKTLDRPVAIKQLKRSYHADSQIVKRFERESRVAASLQHENIVHIYDYWKRPHYAIVMEYVDGTDLAGIIEKTGALPADVGIMIAIQVCSALEYAHMRGLIHRDIKPSNIMVKRNGEVKLMDFGIAHTRNLEAITMPGTLIGTPAYMSPEQILGQPLDARSDIFSFGIVLYETLTGVKPFTDEETRAVTAKIMKDGFTSPRRVNSAIPCGVQRIIKKCLRKKPQRRYASMMDLEKKLGKRLAGRTTKAASLLRISDYLVSREGFRGRTRTGNDDHHGQAEGVGAVQECRCRRLDAPPAGGGGRSLPLLPDDAGTKRRTASCCFAGCRDAARDTAAGDRVLNGDRDLSAGRESCRHVTTAQLPGDHDAAGPDIAACVGRAETYPDNTGPEKDSRSEKEEEKDRVRQLTASRLPLIRSNIRLGRLSCAVSPVR